MRVRRLSILYKIAHLQLSSLLINPNKALFQLVLQSSIFCVFQIAVLLSVSVYNLVEVWDFLFELLDFAGIVFRCGLKFLELQIKVCDLLFEKLDLVLLFSH